MLGTKKKGKIKIKREKEKQKEMEMVRTAGTPALIVRTMLAVCGFPRSPLSKSKRGDLFPLKPSRLEGWAHGKFLPGSCRHGSGFVGWAHGRSNGRARGAFFRAAQGLPDVPGLPAPPSRSPASPCAERGSDWGAGPGSAPRCGMHRVRIGAAHR